MASPKTHRYTATLVWTGAAGGPAEDYETYNRASETRTEGKPAIPTSADPAFRGDAARWNPEDMLVGALANCHMLWYLHLATVKGVVVTAYEDAAEGTMLEEPRNGRFTGVTLHPRVTITPDSDPALAEKLHERAHTECFIANSMNFPVTCEPEIVVAG